MKTKIHFLALCTAIIFTACTKQEDDIVTPATTPSTCTGKSGGQCPTGNGGDRPTPGPNVLSGAKAIELTTVDGSNTWVR